MPGNIGVPFQRVECISNQPCVTIEIRKLRDAAVGSNASSGYVADRVVDALILIATHGEDYPDCKTS